MFLKYEVFLCLLKLTKRMNKFDRISVKLQIYFHYIYKQIYAIWKKYMAALPGVDP